MCGMAADDPKTCPEPTEFGAELFDAVFDGDVTRMQQALAMLDYPVDCYNEDGMTPLAVAATSGHHQLLERLIEPFGTKPGADVDARCRGGATSLMFAAWHGHRQCVQILLDHGAESSAMDDDGMTPLMWAMDGEHQELVQMLLPLDDTSLFSAAEWGYTTVVGALLGLGVPPDALDPDGNTALLRIAMSTLHFENRDWTEIDTCAAVAELLVNSGASLEATDPQYEQTALGWALKTCKPCLAETLRSLGANVEAHAAQRCRVRGQTLLISSVTELLEGSDESPYDLWPVPRRVIAQRHLVGIVELQIRMGAKLGATDSSGRTCLMHAAELGDPEVLLKLLGSAEVDAADYEGQTALVYAAMQGHERAVDVLLQHGANPAVKDRTGNHLWQAAELAGHHAVSQLIQARVGMSQR